MRKLALLLLYGVQGLRMAFYRAVSTNRVQGAPRRLQPVHAVGRGSITCAQGVQFGFFPSPHFLHTVIYLEARHASARIRIGAHTTLNNGFVAIAEHHSISIGARVLVGTGVEIVDSDFHGLALAQRRVSAPEQAASVTIGDDVFIGSNVRILKGVTVGKGAVIAQGAVVTHAVPPYSVVGGVPARVIGQVPQ